MGAVAPKKEVNVALGVGIEQTRKDIRATFDKWGIPQENREIAWEDKGVEGKNVRFPYGVRVRYLRNGIWQEVACLDYGIKAENLRNCFFLIDRLRIAEKKGVQYQGLSYTKEVVAKAPNEVERERKEVILDAYDILGGGPDDPIELIKDLYRKKSVYYHPDKAGGDAEKFKRLTRAYELILSSRGER
jgi:hypothetical protein